MRKIVFLIISILIYGCNNYTNLKKEENIQSKNFIIKRFYFGRMYEGNTNLIQFTKKNNAYSLKIPSKNIEICKDVYYIKTFGGTSPSVTVYLVNNRILFK